MYETILDKFEEDIKNGLGEMLNKMHKHSIEDHILSLKFDCDIDERSESVEHNFEKMLKTTLHLIIHQIHEDISGRLLQLKEELEIKYNITKIEIKDKEEAELIMEAKNHGQWYRSWGI